MAASSNTLYVSKYIEAPAQLGPWSCMFCGRTLKRRGRCCSHAECLNLKAYFHYYRGKGYPGKDAFVLAIATRER